MVGRIVGGGFITYGDFDLLEHVDAFQSVFESDVLRGRYDDGACMCWK